ncbi:MAG: LpqB family beta-propeller domain-containing protein, partial [Demequinaceae bacterium]|nr:LpqB family beta-propeller domain-containing protein [Demequinaceae bacterium]
MVALVVAACATISGCASIPTTGAVQAGKGDVPFDEDFYPIPPQIPEDDPLRLVEGFLAASAAGVAGDFSDERGYLLGPAASEWDPSARVTIYGTSDFTPALDEAAQTVSFSLPLAATVDPEGRMTEYEEGTRTTVTFGVTELLPGRWRISSLDDGIVISEAGFDLVFRAVYLAFGSRDGDIAVPELRWLPRRNTATHATAALIGGPSSWLEDAVQTGLYPTAELIVKAVPIEDYLANVALTEGSTGSAAERSLALEQILHTLLPLPDVANVTVTVGGLPIGGDGSIALEESPVPSSRAAVIADHRIGVWDGERLFVIDGGGRLPADARDVAFAYDGETVALVVGEGNLAIATVPSDLVAIEDAEIPTIDLGLTTVFEGANLVAPSFDREGWLWTAEAE